VKEREEMKIKEIKATPIHISGYTPLLDWIADERVDGRKR